MTTYVYIFDYSVCSITEVEIQHVRNHLTNEEIEGILDWDFNFSSDEISYMVSDKKLNIKNLGKAYA